MAEASNQREQRILNAAAELIAHYGYDKTTMDEIARAAGISKGAVYLHFKSKEHLLASLLSHETEALKERYFELLAADPQGTSIFTIYRYGLEIIDESPLIKAMFTQDKRVLGDYLRKVRDTPAYAEVINFSNDAMRQFQQAGLIRADVDPVAASYLLNALSYGLLVVDEILPGGQSLSMKQLGPALADMIANGLAPRNDQRDQQAARETLENMYAMKMDFIDEQEQNTE